MAQPRAFAIQDHCAGSIAHKDGYHGKRSRPPLSSSSTSPGLYRPRTCSSIRPTWSLWPTDTVHVAADAHVHRRSLSDAFDGSFPPFAEDIASGAACCKPPSAQSTAAQQSPLSANLASFSIGRSSVAISSRYIRIHLPAVRSAAHQVCTGWHFSRRAAHGMQQLCTTCICSARGNTKLDVTNRSAIATGQTRITPEAFALQQQWRRNGSEWHS